MRVLIVNDGGLAGGGAEARIKSLIEGLEDRGVECAVLAHKDATQGHKRWYAASQREAESILSHAINDFKPDMVQFHNLAQFSAGLIPLAKSKGVKTIFFAHDYWPFCGKRTLVSSWKEVCETRNLIKCSFCVGAAASFHLMKNKSLLNKADVGIAPTDAVIRLFEKNNILNKKWKKVSGWVDTEFFSEVTHKPKKGTIVYIGPLTFDKGFDDAIKAFADVAKDIPKATLRIVGPGQEEHTFTRIRADTIIKKHALQGRVIFAGFKDQEGVREELSKAALYLCPPRWPELFGQTWAQALAVGCPVLATPVGSIPEVAGGNVMFAKPEGLGAGITLLLNEGKQQRILLSKEFPLKQLVGVYRSLFA